MKNVDFHSHIIPYIDDGAKNAKSSIALLKESYNQGVTDIVATPHFCGTERDVDFFINKRAAMLEILQERISKENILIPNIYTGAEVMLQKGLSDYDNLNSLCIENTDYILIEMPYADWSDSLFVEINNIIKKRQLIPIIAHVERYFDAYTSYEKYKKLVNLDVILQFNATSFFNLFSKNKLKELIKRSNNRPVILGSDCHDIKFRSTHLKKAYKTIKKHYGKEFFNKICEISEYILQNKRF